MSKSNKGWSERRRKQQACNARRNKPWTRSTGPKSDAGKAVSSMNAYKHGHYTAAYQAVRAALRLNRDFLRYAALFFAFEQQRETILSRKRTNGKPNDPSGTPHPPAQFPGSN